MVFVTGQATIDPQDNIHVVFLPYDPKNHSWKLIPALTKFMYQSTIQHLKSLKSVARPRYVMEGWDMADFNEFSDTSIR